MADNTNGQNNANNQGFAGMNDDEQRDIASQGGHASSSQQDMSELGKKGAEAQPTDAKRRGGERGGSNSQRNQ